MTDHDYIEFKTLNFAANLLENKPDILKDRAEFTKLFDGMGQRFSESERNDFVEDLIQLPDLSKACEQELISFRDTHESVSRCLHSSILKCLVGSSKILVKWLRHLASGYHSDQNSGLKSRVDEIAQCLGLSVNEREALELVYFSKEQIGIFEDGLWSNHLCGGKLFDRSLSHFLNSDKSLTRKSMSSMGTLFRLKILRRSLYRGTIDIHEDTSRFISGEFEAVSYMDAVFDRSENAMYEVPPSIDTSDEKLLKSFLLAESGCNILFYGEPGTGKSTLARTICASLGLSSIPVKNPESCDQDDRITNFLCATAIAESASSKVVIVDEADRMLCTRTSWIFNGIRSDKGWLNKTLETTKAKIIWISNSIDGIEPETLRRFGMSLRFKSLTRSQRAQVWRTQISRHPGLSSKISENDIVEFSNRFPVQAGQIADTIRHIAALKCDITEVRPLIERCLESHQERSETQRKMRPLDWVQPCRNHSIEGLSTNLDLPRSIKLLHEFTRRQAEGKDTLGIKNMNVLLSGPPGTGKTEFAKFLAQELGRDLIIKSASDLQSMWVGGTEKNIAQAFEEAASNEALLFIDEADSFLWSRQSAVRSYEVSHVNEFLSQMERFQGILICASNFQDRFDSASLRRFNLKIGFDWLTPDGGRLFFDRYFQSLVASEKMTEHQLARLARIKCLAPGDFKVVFQRNALLKEADINIDFLLGELEAETSYKDQTLQKQIGFRS